MLMAVQHTLMFSTPLELPSQTAGLWLTALLVNALLISFAQRFPLLTRAGWCHAGILGTVLWGSLAWRGWLAVVAYLVLGSLVTKLGFARKQQLGLAEGRGGRRGPENVWGSAFTGLVLALLIAARIGSPTLLLIGFCASFAAKLADTFGSEIGKRWGGQPLLITTLRPVPAGTEGAISLEGTLASAAGSVVMTLVLFSLQLLPSLSISAAVMLIGLIATLAESFLGALAQDRVAWLSNELVNAMQTSLAALLAIVVLFRWM